MAPLSSLLSQPKSPSGPRSASSEVEDSPQPASAEAVDPPQPDLIKAEDLSDIQSDTTESEYPSDSQPDTTDFEEGSDAESNAKSEMMDELFEEEETRNDEKLQIAPVSQFHESKPWIANYREEEQRGIAILQRRRRLTRENSDRNDDELIQLNGEYWMHQVRFRRIQIAELPNNDYVEAMMIPRRYLDRHGCPYDWRHKCNDCASDGGCCGRSCGCYEEALDGPNGEKVYGHCTFECECCIRRRGCYCLDQSLPPTRWDGYAIDVDKNDLSPGFHADQTRSCA